MQYRVVCADVVEWARAYNGPPFHAILCDPPYHISFMNKDWDKESKEGNVAFRPSTWEALARPLHPGGFVMAFGGGRTCHRLACAMEDAGLIMHESIFWLRGTHLPKATRIDTQIDEAAGKTGEREVVGEHPNPARNKKGETVFSDDNYEWRKESVLLTAPATDLARTWEGHRYGRQALKVLGSIIVVAQKPYAKGMKTWQSIVGTGAGALWIDGARLGIADHDPDFRTTPAATSFPLGGPLKKVDKENGHPLSARHNAKGRHPPNVIIQHSPLCHRLDGVRRVRNDSGSVSGNEPSVPTDIVYGAYERTAFVKHGDPDGMESIARYACALRCEDCGHEWAAERRGLGCPECGGDGVWTCAVRTLETTTVGKNDVSRYFFQASWEYEVAERIAGAVPFLYCPKPSRREKDAGLEREMSRSDFRPNDPDENSLRTRLHGSVPHRNPHPTLKPITLCKWLCRLLAPPVEYAPRRLLVPFAGVGSEISAAILSGCWEEIVGIELEEEYVKIAEARCQFWQTTKQEAGSSDPRAILKVYGKKSKVIPGSQEHLPF